MQIDATNAFGTGEHPTTRGCLELLEKNIQRHETVARGYAPAPTSGKRGRVGPRYHYSKMLDVGCGSGILAMAFASLLCQGFGGQRACGGRAIAVDNDPQSVAIARRNVRANDLRKYVTIAQSEGFSAEIVRRHAPYDLIMANIFADPLCAMAKDMKRHLRPGGQLILSGILSRQAKDVVAAYKRQGFSVKRRLKLGEWVAMALT